MKTMANSIANLLKPTLTEQMACNKTFQAHGPIWQRIVGLQKEKFQ